MRLAPPRARADGRLPSQHDPRPRRRHASFERQVGDGASSPFVARLGHPTHRAERAPATFRRSRPISPPERAPCACAATFCAGPSSGPCARPSAPAAPERLPGRGAWSPGPQTLPQVCLAISTPCSDSHGARVEAMGRSPPRSRPRNWLNLRILLGLEKRCPDAAAYARRRTLDSWTRLVSQTRSAHVLRDFLILLKNLVEDTPF